MGVHSKWRGAPKLRRLGLGLLVGTRPEFATTRAKVKRRSNFLHRGARAAGLAGWKGACITRVIASNQFSASIRKLDKLFYSQRYGAPLGEPQFMKMEKKKKARAILHIKKMNEKLIPTCTLSTLKNRIKLFGTTKKKKKKRGNNVTSKRSNVADVASLCL